MAAKHRGRPGLCGEGERCHDDARGFARPRAATARDDCVDLCKILLKPLPIGGRTPQELVDLGAVVSPPSKAELRRTDARGWLHQSTVLRLILSAGAQAGTSPPAVKSVQSVVS